jgi:hypothetical protein
MGFNGRKMEADQKATTDAKVASRCATDAQVGFAAAMPKADDAEG